MAAYDRTQLEPFYKLFPELTHAQTEYVLLFSLGFSHKENARILERSPRTVEHRLNAAKIRLDLDSTS